MKRKAVKVTYAQKEKFLRDHERLVKAAFGGPSFNESISIMREDAECALVGLVRIELGYSQHTAKCDLLTMLRNAYRTMRKIDDSVS